MVEQVQPAFEKLKATFKSGKTKTIEWRKKMIGKFMQGLDEMKAEFGVSLKEDLGRDPFMTEVAENTLLREGAKHELLHLEEWMADEPIPTEMLMMPAESVIRYEPLGVVGVFGAWNFPYATTLRPMLNAIIAGNCVLVKPSEISPSSSRVMKKFCDTYMTEEGEEAVICIEGAIDVGIAVNNLKLDLICFTGSTSVGKIIAQTAAKNLTPVILELGGKCPVVVDASADLEFTVKKLAYAKATGSG